jgi:hypothetical protein
MAALNLDKESAYVNALNTIAALSANDSVSQVLQEIEQIPEDTRLKDAILIEMDKSRIFPDSFMKIITFMYFLIDEKRQIHEFYEQAMERYETINKLTAKGRPTEDEAKIKKTLTDFILKIESLYEAHFKADDGILKELSRHMAELNIKPGTIDRDLLNYKVSSRSIGQLQPNMVVLLDAYFQYKKNKGILKRLVKISNYIIEDAQKRA